jgi:hypothetical protein
MKEGNFEKKEEEMMRGAGRKKAIVVGRRKEVGSLANFEAKQKAMAVPDLMDL